MKNTNVKKEYIDDPLKVEYIQEWMWSQSKD